MKKLWGLAGLVLFTINVYAMSDAAQAVTVTSAAGLINAGTAIYMQGQGMNPQFVVTPNGTTVIPNTPDSSNTSGFAYTNQNQQSNKQEFFNSN